MSITRLHHKINEVLNYKEKDMEQTDECYIQWLYVWRKELPVHPVIQFCLKMSSINSTTSENAIRWTPRKEVKWCVVIRLHRLLLLKCTLMSTCWEWQTRIYSETQEIIGVMRHTAHHGVMAILQKIDFLGQFICIPMQSR